MSQNLKGLLVFVLLVITCVILIGSIQPLYAQPPIVPPGNPCPGGPPCNPDVPISGIEILLVLGGALGLRKFARSKSVK
jgi:hypothetical protein